MSDKLPEIDLRKMIADWYRCKRCGRVLYGLMAIASHLAKIHGIRYMDADSPTDYEVSYYGTGWDNPSRRDGKDTESILKENP